jgi:hypothetical protein
MNEKIIIHCDACDSTSVLHEEITGPPQEVHMTMTERANKSSMTITYDTYIYSHYRMVCKDCGHIVKYYV